MSPTVRRRSAAAWAKAFRKTHHAAESATSPRPAQGTFLNTGPGDEIDSLRCSNPNPDGRVVTLSRMRIIRPEIGSASLIGSRPYEVALTVSVEVVRGDGEAHA